ncbi:MAG TPA: NB-ARC domain-containing protein, partial [Anaerolineae bacterium]|nr:NB-ARC domain-containing protein [Anaerolineae bacterium]
MSNNVQEYNIAAIHELLLAAFTAEDLRRFCLEDTRFRPIYNRFGPSHGFDDTVDEVVEYCRTHSVWPEFLAAVQQARPKTYARFEPRLGVPVPSAYIPPPPPDPDQLPEAGPLLPGSRLPFERNHLFTGREAQLKALAKALLHDDAGSTLITQTIQGMGGIGKTQLAVEFAHRYGRFFHGVHWLHCGQPDAIAAEIAACGPEMALSPWPQDQPGQVERTLQAWGQDGHRHLVILDNLEDVEAARGWLRRLRDCGAALLLTARETNWPEDLGLSPLPIRLFTKAESRRFLRQ